MSVTGPSAGGPPGRRCRRVPLGPLPALLLAGLAAAAGGVGGQRAAAATPPTAASPATPAAPSLPAPVAPSGIVSPLPLAAPGPVPLEETTFLRLLGSADLDRLALLCRQLVDAGDGERLRRLRQRLLTIHPAPQPLPVVLANADVLLTCRMPEAALTVLDRSGPARGAEQVQWLTLQWRAANAALDHRRAAVALERLAAERPALLESTALPLQPRQDGTWVSRSALEVLASHLESAGLAQAAASLLLLSSGQDSASVERLAQAVRLLADLPPSAREPLFERVLEQAAAVGSWGLVGELLTLQASLPASPEAAARTAERRERLSRRLDDAYGAWRALEGQADPGAGERRRQLEVRLRSPLAPGGHAATLVPPSAEGGDALPADPAAPPGAAPALSPTPLP